MAAFLVGSKPASYDAEQEQIWEQWVDFDRRDRSDLVNLINRPYKNEYKARALSLLLAITSTDLLVYWNDTEFMRRSYLASSPAEIDIPNLDKEMQLLLRDMVLLQLGKLMGKKDLSEVEMSCVENLNRYLFKLLIHLPEKETEDVFQNLTFLDVFQFSNLEDASGYRMFDYLLQHPKISEDRKTLADRRLRKIVESEVRGETRPRTAHEDALKFYISILKNVGYRGGLLYSRELYISQWLFVLDMGKLTPLPAMYWYELKLVWPYLSGDEGKEIRASLVALVMSSTAHNGIWDVDTLYFVESVFKERDLMLPVTHQVLSGLIELSREQIEKQKQEQLEQKRQEEVIVSKMRLA